MTIIEYLKSQNDVYEYVGTIWGDNTGVFSGYDLARMLEETGYSNEEGYNEIVNGYNDRDYGYIVTEIGVWYRSPYVEQRVIKRL